MIGLWGLFTLGVLLPLTRHPPAPFAPGPPCRSHDCHRRAAAHLLCAHGADAGGCKADPTVLAHDASPLLDAHDAPLLHGWSMQTAQSPPMAVLLTSARGNVEMGGWARLMGSCSNRTAGPKRVCT